MDSADVVIVGGGVIGASIAYHLARAGQTNVALFERQTIASGSTGRAAGGIRQQFSTAINIRLSRAAVSSFERFEAETGFDPEFRQYGYLLLAVNTEQMALFRRNVALQRELGVPVELISPAEVTTLVPRLRLDDVVGATFCPTDGYADPHTVAHAYATDARRLGARLYEGVEVTGLRVSAGKIEAVETTQGVIATPVVVDAAGPYAAIVAAMAGIDLPIQPSRRQLFFTEPFTGLPERLPMVVDWSSGLYFRREGPGILLGLGDEREPYSFNTTVDWGFLERVVEKAIYRVPGLAQAEIKTGWAGLYDITPDAHAIVGPVPGCPGFYSAAGFSGHGFMHSPAIGQVMAELLVEGQARTVDIAPLSITRFAEGRSVREANVF